MGRLLTLAIAAALAACGGTPEAVTAVTGEPLKVCVAPEDPPRSTRPGVGFDVDVAKLIAGSLGRPLELVWLPRPNLHEIEETDLNFGPLMDGVCSLQLSVPGVAALEEAHDALALSRPYYGTAFELVPASADLERAERVAVRSNTVAHIVVDRRGFSWTMQPDTGSVLAALESGRADVALVWGPDLAGTDVTPSRTFEAPRVLRWNQHAAVRTNDTELLANVDAALDDSSDAVQALLERHGIPQRTPFDDTHQAEDLLAL